MAVGAGRARHCVHPEPGRPSPCCACALQESLKAIDRPLFKDYWPRFLECLRELNHKVRRAGLRRRCVGRHVHLHLPTLLANAPRRLIFHRGSEPSTASRWSRPGTTTKFRATPTSSASGSPTLLKSRCARGEGDALRRPRPRPRPLGEPLTPSFCALALFAGRDLLWKLKGVQPDDEQRAVPRRGASHSKGRKGGEGGRRAVLISGGPRWRVATKPKWLSSPIWPDSIFSACFHPRRLTSSF